MVPAERGESAVKPETRRARLGDCLSGPRPRSGRSGRRPTSVAGFSLLEVLVAVSIMALALGSLYQLSTSSTRNAAHLERHAYAVVMAQSLLATLDQVPPTGIRRSGETEDGFAWRLSSRAADPRGKRTESVPMWPFHVVTVEVSWRNLGRQHEVVLETALPQADIAGGAR
ncbi:MAG: prepilin-type N-terminal cleavage/methylation domain-containing protein [Rhodocyclaceae bacterium]